MRPHIIGGNWKLQINSISEVKIRLTQILNDLQNKNINLSKIFIALPPALLHIGHELFKNSKINQARKKLLKNERNFSPCNKCDVNGLLNGN